MTDEDKARAWLREYRHDTCDDNHRDDLPSLAALLREVRDEEREAGVRLDTAFYMVAWKTLFWSVPTLNREGMTWVHLWPDAMRFASREQAEAVASSIIPDIDTKARVVEMLPSAARIRAAGEVGR